MSEAYDSRIAKAIARAAAGSASSSDESSIASPILNSAVDLAPTSYPLGWGNASSLLQFVDYNGNQCERNRQWR
jgi:hypothetical protein